MKKTILTLLFLIFSCYLYSQESWKVKKTEFNGQLRSIHFITSKVGYAVGENGAFLSTIDGGNSWKVSYLPGNPNLYSVCFKTSSLGFVTSGDPNTKAHIYKTTDAGITWSSIYSIDSAIFTKFKIFYINSEPTVAKCFVTVKSKSTTKILHSSNSGVNWSKQTSAIGEINGCWFIPNSLLFGWYVGTNGGINRISSISENPSPQLSPNFNDLQEVQAFSYYDVYTVGSNGTFLKTINGGENWNEVAVGNDDDLNDMHYINLNTGWITGNSKLKTGNIYKTSDANKTFIKQFSSDSGKKINSLFFFNADLGFAAGDSGLIVKYTSTPENTITTGALSNTKFCKVNNFRDSISIPFILNGKYITGNIFKLQLSDETGSFANPIVIGQVEQTTLGNIKGYLGDSLQISNAQSYKLRIISTDPEVIGAESPSAIGLYSIPEKIALIGGGEFCSGDSLAYIRFDNLQKGFTYKVTLNNKDFTSFYMPANGSYTIGNIITSGTYKVIAFNNLNPNCSMLMDDSVVFVIKQIPLKPEITIGEKWNILKSSSPIGNQWYFNGEILKDSTNQLLIPQKEGNYYVVVTIDGCSSDKSDNLLFKTTNINEFITAYISISPNPASDYITIQNVIPAKAGIYVEIFNIFGEKVEQTSLSVQNGQTGMSDLLKINISKLPAGVYFIRVGDKFVKFVKM